MSCPTIPGQGLVTRLHKHLSHRPPAPLPRRSSSDRLGPEQPTASPPLLIFPSQHSQREPQDVHLTTSPTVLTNAFLEPLAIDFVIVLPLSKSPVKMVLKVKMLSGLAVLFGAFI